MVQDVARQRIAKTLFRSMLRWNRQQCIYSLDRNKELPYFTFNLERILGYETIIKLQKAGPSCNIPSQVDGCEVLQYMIFDCFRSLPASSGNIDLGFEVVKALNSVKGEMKEQVDKRLSSTQTDPKLLDFRIGDVVQHKEYAYRAVVTGWKMTGDSDNSDNSGNSDADLGLDSSSKPASQRQQIKILVDLWDFEKVTQINSHDTKISSKLKYHGAHDVLGVGATLGGEGEEGVGDGFQYYDSSLFEAVQRPDLRRIYNTSIQLYFDGYCNTLNKFRPLPNLQHLYPADYRPPTGHADPEVMQAAQNVLQCTSSFGYRFLSILDPYRETLSISTSTSTSSTLPLLPTEAEISDMDEIFQEFRECAEVCAAATINTKEKEQDKDRDLYTHHSFNPRPTLNLGGKQRLLLQSLRMTPEQDISSSSSNSSKRGRKRSNINSSSSSSSSSNSKSSSPPSVEDERRMVDRASRALGHLAAAATEVDRLLQLRFQHKGVAFYEGLTPDSVTPTLIQYQAGDAGVSRSSGSSSSIDNSSSSDDSSNSSTDDSSSSSSSSNAPPRQNKSWIEDSSWTRGVPRLLSPLEQAAVAPLEGAQGGAWASAPRSEQVECANRVDEQLNLPRAILEVGAVVRHKQFGYRAVIRGFDQRPLVDVSQWEGVVHLEEGDAQPFYMVVPDEADVERVFGANVFRPYYYVAQANLERVTKAADMQIKHRHLSYYFPRGFDQQRQAYQIPPKLSYCFPPISHKEGVPALSSSEDEEEVTEEERASRGEEREKEERGRELHRSVDRKLLEAFRLVRSTFNTSQLEYTNRRSTGSSVEEHQEKEGETEAEDELFGIDDLLLLLRHSERRDSAQLVESMIWLVWMSHPQPHVNKLMHTGTCHSRRGRRNDMQALETYKLITAMEPLFPEAWNKLAAMMNKDQSNAACIKYAKAALELFPDHYGAYAGLGLSHEREGEVEEAIQAITSALRIHPWAAHLPTLLLGMLQQQGAGSNTPTSVSGTEMEAETDTPGQSVEGEEEEEESSS